MKSFKTRSAVILVAISCQLLSCNGQNDKPAARGERNSLPTFEEKQAQALGHQSPASGEIITPNFNFRYAARKTTPGVVHINAVFPGHREPNMPDLFNDFFGDDFFRRYFRNGETPGKQQGSASGVIISNDGYIVTNNHVINEAESIAVVLHDQRNYKARVIGTDPATDLALLKIDEKNLAFVEFGNSDSVAVGDFVLAVGNPFNLASTVTAGIVSAKARNINLLTDRWAVESYIQTDAAMNPGNSGGALVDVNGKLIGITAAIASPTGAYAGYSFAIPIDIVKKSINDLLRYGKVIHGYLGLIISDMNGQKAKLLGINETTGVFVDSLENNGPAIKAGIRKNDVIKKIGGRIVETAPEFRELVARAQPGERLLLTVLRNRKELVVPVVLMPLESIVKNPALMNSVLKDLGIAITNLSAEEKQKLHLAGGIKITDILPGKIADQTNMRTGFIITRVNEKTVNNVEGFTREFQNKKGGIMLEGIYPNVNGVYYYAFGL